MVRPARDQTQPGTAMRMLGRSTVMARRGGADASSVHSRVVRRRTDALQAERPETPRPHQRKGAASGPGPPPGSAGSAAAGHRLVPSSATHPLEQAVSTDPPGREAPMGLVGCWESTFHVEHPPAPNEPGRLARQVLGGGRKPSRPAPRRGRAGEWPVPDPSDRADPFVQGGASPCSQPQSLVDDATPPHLRCRSEPRIRAADQQRTGTSAGDARSQAVGARPQDQKAGRLPGMPTRRGKRSGQRSACTMRAKW
jgi:hypothetical protein